MSRNDRYNSFSELDRNETRGIDYEIELIHCPESQVAIIAPHGGGIEPRTSEVAKRIAKKDFSFYSFKGIKKPNGNNILHITSHNFNEPTCLNLIAEHDWVIAIHGCNKDGDTIYLGGRDDNLIDEITATLNKKGFDTQKTGHIYPGRDKMNICNRGKRSVGVQIELTMQFRRSNNVEQFADLMHELLIEKQNAV